MQAWKLKNGRYRLIFDGGTTNKAVSRWAGTMLGPGGLEVSAEAVEEMGTEKVFGVIAGPSSCGCEPAMFRWVGAKEVEEGRTKLKVCPTCVHREITHPICHRCDIVDVCGEPDVARAVYEAEFADKIAHLAGESR